MYKVLLTEQEYSELNKNSSDMSQEKFDRIFLKMLKSCSKTYFLDFNGNRTKLPSDRVELCNSNDQWMFDIEYIEYPHFYFSKLLVFDILKNKYGLEYNQIQDFMKKQMQELFKLDANDITPFTFSSNKMEEELDD